ncbi:MAG: FtsX-like permease family protein [Deltaproteobacteria bacterium]
MKYEFFIGLRYLASKRRQTFISVIGLISILGVFIGVMALNVVLAVMKGFEEELMDKIVGVNSHVVVLSYDGPLGNYEETRKKVLAYPGVVGASPFVYGQGMMVGEASVVGVVVRGIDPANAGSVTNIKEAIGRGSVGREKKTSDSELAGMGKEILEKLNGPTKSGRPAVIIGKELASSLAVEVGDLINLVSPLGKFGPFGPQPKVKRFEIIGLFDYGMLEYDSSIAYVSLKDATDFFEMDGRVSGIEISVANVYKARDLGSGIASSLGFPFYTRNWEEVNKSLFRALRLERIAIAIFLGLIILVAALDIVSTLTMVVMEKGRDIAILRAMGATQEGIMKIFIIDGMIIGVVGTLLGTVAGFLACYLIKTSDLIKGLIPFDPEVYFVSDFPVKIEPFYFLTVAGASLLICFLATLYPSYQASRKDPVEALRYE